MMQTKQKIHKRKKCYYFKNIKAHLWFKIGDMNEDCLHSLIAFGGYIIFGKQMEFFMEMWSITMSYYYVTFYCSSGIIFIAKYIRFVLLLGTLLYMWNCTVCSSSKNSESVWGGTGGSVISVCLFYRNFRIIYEYFKNLMEMCIRTKWHGFQNLLCKSKNII